MNTGPTNAIWVDRHTLVTLHDAIRPYRTQPIYTVEFREFTPGNPEIGNPAETYRMLEVVDNGDGELLCISIDAKVKEMYKATAAVRDAEMQYEAIKAGDTIPTEVTPAEYSF